MKKRQIGSRSFVRDVTGVAVAISVLVIATVTYLSLKAQRDVSEQYIHDATALAAEEFRSMQSSIEDSLELVRRWGAEGLVSLSKPDELRKLLFPIFGKERLLAGISIADSEGRSYFILPDGTERTPAEADGFDSRTRPWYAPALATPGVYWSEQYLFHTIQQLGVTASASFAAPKEKKQLVVAFDILLPDFYRKIKALAPSENSEFFIFRRDEMLFLPESTTASSGFVPLESVTNALMDNVHAFLGKERGGEHKEVFSFTHEGMVWWCGFRPLENAYQNIWMGVVVPEADIIGDIGRRRMLLLFFGLVFILVSAAGAVWLARRYGRMFGNETHLAECSPEGVLDLIAQGENRYIEFKSTLRMNLHSKKPGKEIELAWLKGVAGFLNTDGGTLLLGVTDDGEITGIEQDVFENEDKCRLHFKNLIATHLGAEKSKYIRFRLVPLEGKTVGVILCARAAEPVFLKNGNKEAFYIRNGPSSDELPVSKALHYIKHRK